MGLVWATPGMRNKAATIWQLALAARRSRYRVQAASAAPEDLAADTWADYSILRFVSRNINVRIDRTAVPRVWFVLPELNASVIFGGYIAVFECMRYVQSLGIETGIISLQPPSPRAQLLEEFKANPVAHAVLEKSQLQKIGVSSTLALGAGDMLVSYNWTASLVAARMARFLDDPAYYYFAQEDERIFYSNDSYRFLCESVFHSTPRPRLICNSSKLRAHFLSEGLIGEETVVSVFEQGIQHFDLPSEQELASRSPRKFAFYGRPEAHAKRNLMTVAMLALAKAKRDGAFNAEPWEFYMLGSQKMGSSFELEGMTIKAVPNQSYENYRRTLTGFDAGMCLMYAPHPSVPPFEMVRSGMVTVVNTNRARSDDWYREVSANFEPGFPSVDGLAAAIARATARVGDVASRRAAASTYHPADWSASFAHLPADLGHRVFGTVSQEINL